MSGGGERRSLPGWLRDPPRLLALRRRAVRRLRRRRPRLWHGLLALAVALWWLLDVLAPRERLWPLVGAGAGLAVADSLATWVWLQTGAVGEANPLVGSALAALGAGPGLALRTVWTVGLLVALGWVAVRRWEGRASLAVALVVLCAVGVLHVLTGAVIGAHVVT